MIVRELLAVFGVQYDDKPAQKAASSLDALAQKAKIFAGLLAGGAVAHGIKSFIEQNIEFAEKLTRVSNRLGIQAETLQELRYAAEQAGIEHQALDTAMQKFLIRCAEAVKGTGGAKDSLKELGVHLTDATGKLREPGDLLAQVADGFRRTHGQADRARLAMTLFEEEGVSLIGMLQNGSESLNAMRQEARALGGIMSSESAASAEKLAHAFKRLRHVAQGFGLGILSSLIPLLEKTADTAVKLGKILSVAAHETTILRTAFTVLGVAAVALAIKMVIAFAPAILTFSAIAAAVTAIVLIVDDLINLFSGGESIIGRFLDGFKRAIGKTLDGAANLFRQFKEWILSGVENIASATSKALSNLVPDFLKKGFHATSKVFSQHSVAYQAPTLSVPRAVSSSAVSQSHVYSPSKQNVKVDVHVKTGANPQEIGGEVARVVSLKLEEERRNALMGLIQLAPSR